MWIAAEEVWSTNDEERRTKALAALAPHLPDALVIDALSRPEAVLFSATAGISRRCRQ